MISLRLPTFFAGASVVGSLWAFAAAVLMASRLADNP